MPLGWIGDIVIDREGRVWMVNAQDLAASTALRPLHFQAPTPGMTGG